MCLLVRKIEVAKWHQRKILDGETASGDAITNCLKTKRNALSVWSINSLNELDEAVLAIVSSQEHIDTLDVITIDRNYLEAQGIRLTNTPGLTPYHSFKDSHMDIADLEYTSLGNMAKAIIESIRQNTNRRYTRSDLKRILLEAVNSNKIALSDLRESLRNSLQ